MPGGVTGGVHDLQRVAGEPQHVAIGDRPQILHRSEWVVEACVPSDLVGEGHGVGLVHEDRELSGEVAGGRA